MELTVPMELYPHCWKHWLGHCPPLGSGTKKSLSLGRAVRHQVLTVRERYPNLHSPPMASSLFAGPSLTPQATSSRSRASLSGRWRQ